MSDTGILHFECVGLGEGKRFPIQYTGRGENESPEFILRNLSPKAKTIAITLDDLSHPIFGVFNHWVIWNISAQAKIPNGIPAGRKIPTLGNAIQGVGYGRHRYAGPKPPKGKRHRYCFTIYVLDCNIHVKSWARKKHLLKAVKPHLIQCGSITGVFE